VKEIVANVYHHFERIEKEKKTKRSYSGTEATVSMRKTENRK